jgi:hypothetical protein
MRAALLVLTVVAAACEISVPFECDDSQFAAGITCDGVLTAAREQLAGTRGITKLTAVRGIHCLPAPAGCPDTPVVTLYADLSDGRQLYVSVARREDESLHAQRWRPVEPDA